MSYNCDSYYKSLMSLEDHALTDIRSAWLLVDDLKPQLDWERYHPNADLTGLVNREAGYKLMVKPSHDDLINQQQVKADWTYNEQYFEWHHFLHLIPVIT